MASKLKLIEVEGIKEIDPVISIYNEEKIKVAAVFDSQLSYTYEMAIPLKYLKLNINYPVKFRYNVKLNGQAANHSTVTTIPSGRFIAVFDEGGRPSYAIPISFPAATWAFPTDFSGEYILAAKH